MITRMQPLLIVYGTNRAINNSTKCLARIVFLEISSPHTPVVIVYSPTIMHNHNIIISISIRLKVTLHILYSQLLIVTSLIDYDKKSITI